MYSNFIMELEEIHRPSSLDKLRTICDEIFNLYKEKEKEDIVSTDKTIINNIVKALDNAPIASLDDFLDHNLPKDEIETLPQDNKEQKIKEIKILLNYLKETAIAAFGTPHDFHTTGFTKILYERCKADYITKNPGLIPVDFIQHVEGKIGPGFGILSTNRLAEIWKTAEDAVYEYIKTSKRYNIALPRPFLYETRRGGDEVADDVTYDGSDDGSDDVTHDGNHDVDGRIESLLLKMNKLDEHGKPNADDMLLFIDTAHSDVLREYHNKNGKAANLNATVATIDAAKQPTRDGLYVDILGMENEGVCIGDICFYLRRDEDGLGPPKTEYPIVITRNERNERNEIVSTPIMCCQREAGVTILSNLIFLIPGADRYGITGRSKTQTNIFKCCLLPGFDPSITDSFVKLTADNIKTLFTNSGKGQPKLSPDKKTELIMVLLACKAAGDKCPIDFVENSTIFYERRTIKWFMTGDLLAAIACKYLTAYNRPNGRTDFYIPPYNLKNPDTEILNKLFVLKNSLDDIDTKNCIGRIRNNIRSLYDSQDPNGPGSYMARYLEILADKYYNRINGIFRQVEDLLKRLKGCKDIEQLKLIMDEIRNYIPGLTITPYELENVLYSKVDDIPTGYDGKLNKVYDVMPRKNIVREIIEYTDIPEQIYQFVKGGRSDTSRDKPPPNAEEIFVDIGVYAEPIVLNGSITYNYYKIVQQEDNRNNIIQQFAIPQLVEIPTREIASRVPADRVKGCVIEESIVAGLPEINGILIPRHTINNGLFKDTFMEVLDQYTIVDFLDYISRWPNNCFEIPILDRNARTPRSYPTLVANTITFYQHIMTALYILIENTRVTDETTSIQEDVFAILLNFIQKNIPFYKDKNNCNALLDFIRTKVFNRTKEIENDSFTLFDIEFLKNEFETYSDTLDCNPPSEETGVTMSNTEFPDDSENESQYLPSDDSQRQSGYDTDRSQTSLLDGIRKPQYYQYLRPPPQTFLSTLDKVQPLPTSITPLYNSSGAETIIPTLPRVEKPPKKRYNDVANDVTNKGKLSKNDKDKDDKPYEMKLGGKKKPNKKTAKNHKNPKKHTKRIQPKKKQGKNTRKRKQNKSNKQK